jgi:hypothetical protein
MTLDQSDEIMSHIVGKLRSRISGLSKREAQYLIGSPSERLIEPVAKTIMEKVRPRIKLNRVSSNQTIGVPYIGEYGQEHVTGWDFRGPMPAWTKPYPSNHGGKLHWYDFKDTCFSFAELAEAVMGGRGNHKKIIEEIMDQGKSFSLPQVDWLIMLAKDLSLLNNRNNIFFISYGHGHEYVACVDCVAGKWRKDVYCYEYTALDRKSFPLSGRVFVME